MWRLIAIIVRELLEALGERLSQPTTGRAAGRDDALRDRIRRRVREHESRVRRTRNADQDGA